MSKADPKNYYAYLGVKPSATADQIRAAYHRCAKLCHPDVDPSPWAKARRLSTKLIGRSAIRANGQPTTACGGLAHRTTTRLDWTSCAGGGPSSRSGRVG